MDNLKVAIRSLLSTPGPTIVVIATLALSIGANTAIFSVIEGVLLRPLGYGDDSEVMVLWGTQGQEGSEDLFRLSPADYRDVRTGTDAFDGQVALYRSIGSTLTAAEPAARVGSLTVTPRLFSVLSARPSLGQFFTDSDEQPGDGNKVVLTHASWARRFGSEPAIIGSTLELDSEPYVVVGVTEPGFQFPPGADEVEIYFPMGLSDAVLLEREHRMFDAVARLDRGVSRDAAQAELDALAARLAKEFPDTNRGWGLEASALREEVLGDLSSTLWVLSAAVFLVLLIACANVTNVLVARSTATSREFAVRAALGAGKRSLLMRSLSESLILGVLGWGLGLVLAFCGVALLRGLLPADIPRVESIQVNTGVLFFAIALSVAATVLFGFLPALRSMAPNLVEVLRPAGSFGKASGTGRSLREGMVVIEVALAVVLLVGAGLMVRSFGRLSGVDPGFRPAGVVSMAVKLPRARYSRAEWPAVFEQLVERAEEMPGVDRAGAISDLPMSDVGLDFEMQFTVAGLDAISPTASPNAELRLVLPGYFSAMGMEMMKGRAFDRLDLTRRNVAIVNQTLANRYFRDLDPIGRTLSVDVGELRIVGVVSDLHHEGLQAKYESEVYLPFGAPIATSEMHIVTRSDLETSAVASGLASLLLEKDPQLAPTEIVALSDLLWESLARPRFNTVLLGSLALCATILAMVGIYGIVSFTVSQRRNEIGIRMALGADGRATVRMVVTQAVSVILFGAGLGVLGALAATRFMDRLLFEVAPSDPLTYFLVLVGALLVGLAAAATPARRATRTDPAAALRQD